MESDGAAAAVLTDNKQLQYVGANLTVVPPSLQQVGAHAWTFGFFTPSQQYGGTAVALDLSHNDLVLLEALDGFAAKLESLVVDSNRLCSQQSALPLLPALTTLCVNDNAIDDLDAWLRCLSAKCPALTYLSMLKNPACPNFFTGKDQQDYARYRLYVLHCLPGLKFLDSSPITPAERAEAKRVGHLMRVARPTSAESLPSVTPTEATPGQLLEPDAQREEASKEDEEDPLAPRRGKASFGVSRYIYQGKQSEGNRFITNDEL